MFLDGHFRPDISKNATLKARQDIQSVARDNQYCYIHRYVVARNRITTILDIFSLIKTSWIEKGSLFLIQYPELCNLLLLKKIIMQLKKRRCKVILLIHDISGIRSEDVTKKETEKQVLELADVIISHNKKMTDYLRIEYGLSNPIIELEIFDYLADVKSDISVHNPNIVVAGSLRTDKAGYLNALCDKNPACSFALYGNGYSLPPKENVHYYGVFPSDELPAQLDGRWGLIWDGQTTSTCSGNYGEYLKINNPHKTSLYIAAGIPVIVWSQSAMADYVRNRGVGIVVDDIEHLAEDTRLTDEAYGVLLENVKRESERLRTGYYTRRALQQAEQFLLENK